MSGPGGRNVSQGCGCDVAGQLEVEGTCGHIGGVLLGALGIMGRVVFVRNARP